MGKINSKKKGNKYEQKIRLEFIELGFAKCQTSRYASRQMDDSGVDLVNTAPFNVQCKAVEKLRNVHTILENMPEDGNYNVVFQRKNHQGEIVFMSKADFYEIIGRFFN